MTKMGFGNDKIRVSRVFRNVPVTAAVGGKTHNFRCIFEFHWAQYLQLLKEQNQINDWQYEPIRWDFFMFGYRNKPFEYTPDFEVIDTDDTKIYHECKGYLETKDLSRINRAYKHYGANFWLILQRIPKQGKSSQLIAKAKNICCIKRVVDGTKILRQCKGLLKEN